MTDLKKTTDGNDKEKPGLVPGHLCNIVFCQICAGMTFLQNQNFECLEPYVIRQNNPDGSIDEWSFTGLRPIDPPTTKQSDD